MRGPATPVLRFSRPVTPKPPVVLPQCQRGALTPKTPLQSPFHSVSSTTDSTSTFKHCSLNTPVLTNHLIQLVSAANKTPQRPQSRMMAAKARCFPGRAGALPIQVSGQSLDDVVSVPQTPEHGAAARLRSDGSDNLQRDYKICKGVKTAAGIPPLYMEICCKERWVWASFFLRGTGASSRSLGVCVPAMDLKEGCGSEASRETESGGMGSLGGPTSWQSFAHRSTLHGLRFIFPYSSSTSSSPYCSTSRRLLWSMALLASLVLLVLESTERLAYFLSYPHVTSVDAVVSGSLVFPAVTVCNLNAYRFTRLTQNDLYHAGELLALLDVHLQIPEPHLAEPHVLAFLTEKSNFTNYRPKPFSMREFTERVGHDLKEMMLYCRFQGQECSHQDFKTVY
ncbi:hypothetical protein cypCar_00006190 [Cyprinus carpio]|nr:hypothetical protein cypCar_00006190 [Cyprinus carpio]